MANRAHVTAAAMALGLLHAGTASALGLGDMVLKSFLNEPLSAEVVLFDTRELSADDIRIRLAGVDDFDRLGVERSYFLTDIKFEVQIDPDSGRGVINLSTDAPVLEPFLDFIVEARWPSGRLLREYTVLIDPPAFRQEQAPRVSASEKIAAAEAASTAEERSAASSTSPAASGSPVGSGQVSILDSSLGAGEMPSRPFSAQTLDEPQPGARYMVKRDETLWQIANRARPGDTSVQQAMLDIQRLNPEAFIDGNINQVKAGYIIYLPAEDDISSADLATALAQVKNQNQEWESSRSAAPGVTAAAALRISADPVAAEDRNIPDVAQSGAGASGEVATADYVFPGAGQDEGGAVNTPATDTAVVSQIAMMTERLDALDQLLSIKDAQIARLQSELRAVRDLSTTPPDLASDADSEVAPERVPERVPEVVASAPPESVPARPGTSDLAPAVIPESDSVAAAPPVSRLPAKASGFNFMPWLYGVAGALLVALLGVFAWRRSHPQASDSLAPSAKPSRDSKKGEPVTEDVFASVTIKPEEPGQSDPESPLQKAAAEPKRGSGERGYGERRYDDYIDTDAGDALAEADIYIAYGRYLQAAELLANAIQSDPDNAAYRLKLLELYVDMGDQRQALEQLDELRTRCDSESVAEGERIVGGETLAQAPGRRSEPELAPEPEEPEPEELASAFSAQSAALDLAPPQIEEAEPASAIERDSDARVDRLSDADADASIGTEDDAGLSVELETGADPESGLNVEAGPEIELDAGAGFEIEPDTEADLESELQLQIDPEQEPAAKPELASKTELPAKTGLHENPFYRDVDEEESEDPGSVEYDKVPLPEWEPEPTDEFEADRDSDVAFSGLSIEESPEAESLEDELELNFELADPVAASEAIDLSGPVETEPPREELPDDVDDPSDEELIFAHDADEMATRLDLARAYLDMGDKDGAKSILAEVVRSGDTEQKEEARTLLARIG